jgi:hypothetical protein
MLKTNNKYLEYILNLPDPPVVDIKRVARTAKAIASPSRVWLPAVVEQNQPSKAPKNSHRAM